MFSKANGDDLYIDIGLFGEMSSGKSTLLNAIFSDIVADTNYGRATKVQQQYRESIALQSNENLLRDSRNINQEQKKFEDEKQREFGQSWQKFFGLSVRDTQFHNKGQFDVMASGLIPFDSKKHCNLFRVLDAPGFGDTKTGKAIKEILMQDNDLMIL